MKYLRLQTLLKKTIETSKKCGVSLNLLVSNNKFNQVTEYFTDEQIKLGSIQSQLQEDSKKQPKSKRKEAAALRIFTRNAAEMFKKDVDCS